MNLTRFVDDLRQQLMVAAEAGGEEAGALAARLTATLEVATRLILLEVLSAAASEITRDLAPGSVEVRLRGRDPEFVVTPPPAGPFEEAVESRSDAASNRPAARPLDAASSNPPSSGEVDEGGTSRTTLRLPDQLKVRMEEAAGREGLSVNAWLVRVIAAALENNDRRSARHHPQGGGRYTGWVR